MKDEFNGKIVEEIFGLMTKMYLVKTKKEKMKKANRMKNNVAKKDICHQDYVDCLFEEKKYA